MSYSKLEKLYAVANAIGYTGKSGDGLLSQLIQADEQQKTRQTTQKPIYVIGLDFDGTCVTHEFPKIGKDVPYCDMVLRKLLAHGAVLVLNTMRSGKYLNDAVDWFAQRNIPLYGTNFNPDQGSWTQSPKVYAHLKNFVLIHTIIWLHQNFRIEVFF